VNHDSMGLSPTKTFFFYFQFSVKMSEFFSNFEQSTSVDSSCSKHAFDKRKMLLIFKNVAIVAIIFFLLDHYGTFDFRLNCELDFDAVQILSR